MEDRTGQGVNAVHQWSLFDSHSLEELLVVYFTIFIFVAFLDDLLYALRSASVEVVLVEDLFDLFYWYFATFVKIDLFKDVLQVHFGLNDTRFKAARQELTIIDLAILVSINIVHNFLQLGQISILILLLKSHL